MIVIFVEFFTSWVLTEGESQTKRLSSERQETEEPGGSGIERGS